MMETRTGASYVVSRVGARAAAGLWAHRGSVLVGVLLLAGIVTYGAMSLSNGAPRPLESAAGPPNTDCADTAMAVVFDKSAAAATRAYQCMDASFQQRVSEAQFVQQMRSQNVGAVDKIARIGDHQNPNGGTLVYYALDGNGQSVGYIVYLNPSGKVLKIE
jgi:hypothetical protein